MARHTMEALRAQMAKRGIDAYVVPTADDHESEYVGAHYKARAHLSGFTGSAGILVVLREEAALFTDGRYFIQAQNQLEGSGIDLMRQGEEGVPTPEAYLADKLPKGGMLGFDGRVINEKMAQGMLDALRGHDMRTHVSEDLAGLVWEDRPALPCAPAFELPLELSGRSRAQKLADVRADMEKEQVSALILPNLDEIAWLTNLRGGDIACNPYLLSFLIVKQDAAMLFAQKAAISGDIAASLAADGVGLYPYSAIYEAASALDGAAGVWLDSSKASHAICAALPAGARIVDKTTPVLERKAVKNPVEIENTIQAHIKDGVAYVRFLRWLKDNVGSGDITEVDAADAIERYRAEQEGFLEPSFDTIAGYNANGAMMHYKATPESCAKLAPRGLLLIDSGGQYMQGTTDITRTIALGDVPHAWKVHYTAVLRGMLGLSDAKFLYGCRGINLDILARGPLWQINLDYKCGTGHGVSHIGGVHESPNGFRWRIVPERNDSCVLEEGMITTNEPGVYVEGSHGIRIENELLARKGEKNEYGQFMAFETLTFAPIDTAPVLAEEMTAHERELLNRYHKKVYDTLAPHLTQEERTFLLDSTRAI